MKTFIQKKTYIIAIILISLIGFTSAVSHAAGKYTSVERFIAKQQLIRIFTDSAAGLGNQAASANVIVRLRQMGYKGKFEFIYPDSALDKIATLFDLPKDITSSYFDAKKNIQFTKLKYYMTQYKRNEIPSATLGLTGVSVGTLCEIAEGEGSDISDINSDDCNNFARMLNVTYFVELSPFISGETHDWPSKFDTVIYSKNQLDPFIQINSDNKFIVMPVANLTEAKEYLQNDERGQELLTKKPALKTLINGMDENTINVLPLYGYRVQLLSSCKEDTSNDCLLNHMNNILQIITGARYAQLNGSNEFKKPLVIPVFYNYEREANFLIQLIKGQIWDSITLPYAKNLKNIIDTLQLRSNFYIANADDVNAVKQIQNLKNGQILLLSMGPLPKIVFDGLYTHTSKNTWPQIREGANTFNSLILTSKPHMRCSDEGWEIGYDLVKDAELKIWLENFYSNRGFCNASGTNWQDDTIPNLVGTFILNAHNPASALAHYFINLKEEAIKPENDRIYFALEEVVRRIDVG